MVALPSHPQGPALEVAAVVPDEADVAEDAVLAVLELLLLEPHAPASSAHATADAAT